MGNGRSDEATISSPIRLRYVKFEDEFNFKGGELSRPENLDRRHPREEINFGIKSLPE
jgi:hypothetical protein